MSSPIEAIFATIRRGGAKRLPEAPDGLLRHGLVAAAHARAVEASPALIAAALMHDIGHLLDLDDADGFDDDRDVEHAMLGAGWLALWLPDSVTRPIALHVDAKRYLAGKDPAFTDTLTPMSRASLALQGGAHSATQAAAFEREAFFADALRVREWDDAPDLPDARIGSPEDYRTLIEVLIEDDKRSTPDRQQLACRG
ncbi:MAG: metal-dependent phosphohydrolase [Rhodospirillaceae bacterium]|nr:metal-dependent phosphohydrolase [Rhodospirillaceae bacterium]